MDDISDDTAATLTDHDLKTIKAALWPVWVDLLRRGEIPAADFIGAQSNACNEEAIERFNRMNEELELIEAGTGHVTLVGFDEGAERKEAGGWCAVCATCDDLDGYFQTEAEANAARARHVKEADDR